MRSASKILPSGWRSDLTTRRTISIALVIIIHLLAILLGYLMSPPITVKKRDEVNNFPLINIFDKLIAPKATTKADDKTKHKAPVVPPKTPDVPNPPPEAPLNMMIVSSETFAASDISKIHSTRPAAAAPGAPDGDDAAGAGEGPGGAPLYNAQWYREPTDAEMAYYMPKNIRQNGWGMIICKTIPDNRVEDCREMAETPGSGLARAMRQASWQFRVRPPRRGGEPLIGAWVRIRFDLTVGFTK